MVNRTVLTLAFLFGLLPYCSTIKFAPVASFWAEWVAVLLAVAILAALVVRQPLGKPLQPGSRGSMTLASVPVSVLAALICCAVLLLQMLLRRPTFFGLPLVALALVALSGVLAIGGARLRLSGQASRFTDAWAVGLLVALLLNLVAVLLDRNGLYIYGWILAPRPPQSRADGLVGQANQLAVFSVMAYIAAHYLWARNRIAAWLYILSAGVISVILVACGSRAGIMLYLTTVLLGAFSHRGTTRSVSAWKLSGAAIAILLVVFVAAPWWNAVPPSVEGDVQERVLSTSNAGRVELWRDSFALIRLHPLGGVGFGNFMGARWMELTAPMLEPSTAHTHNLLSQLAVELGVPAAVLITLPLAFGLWQAARAVLRRDAPAEDFFAGAIVLIIAAYALVEFPFWETYFLLPFALAVGLVSQKDLHVRVSMLSASARRAGWGAAGVLCLVMAWDYHRSEALYRAVLYQQHGVSNGSADLTVKFASDVALFSAFDNHGVLMYSRTLEMDGLFPEEKLDVTRRSMYAFLGRESVAREVAFLLVAGERDAALKELAKTRRNPDLAKATLATLRTYGPKYPAVAAFLAEAKVGDGLMPQAAAVR